MLSLCVIVKNEENTLEKCLNSASKLVDEIIIVDTGSIDKTKEIALKYTDKVFDFVWCNDFSKARNFSISKATKDWILVLDADEIIEEFHIESIKEFCKCSDNIVGRIKIVNKYEGQSGIQRHIERVNRLFNKNYFNYKGIIHEQIVCISGKSYDTKNIDLTVNHIGYSKEVLNRTNKIQRNIELLKEALKENSKDPYLYYQLGKSYFMAKDYLKACGEFEIAINVLDDFRYEYAEDLVESYAYALINSMQYEKSLFLEKYKNYYISSPDFYFVLGLAYMNNEMFKQAAEAFLKCTEFKEGKMEGVTSYFPLYNIGVIFECLGFLKEAKEYYNMCKDYDPAKKRLKSI